MKAFLVSKYGKLILLTLVIFAPLLYYMCCVIPYKTDFGFHAQFSQDLAEKGLSALLPHFAFQVLLLLFHAVTRIPYALSEWVLVTIFQVITAVIIFRELNKTFAQQLPYSIILFVTISLLLVHAIPLLALRDYRVYTSYFTANVYHNPTVLLLKPFAILLSLASISIFIPQQGKRTSTDIIYCASLVIISTLAKPNYSIVLLPSLGLLMAVSWWKKDYINYKLLFGGIFIPILVLLASQFMWAYVYNESAKDSSIVFAPFRVALHTSSKWYLLPKLILSIAFPLYLLIAYYNEIIKNKALVFSWVCFIVALLYVYLLAEAGHKVYHGNFLWGAQITLFLLFFYSVIFLLQKIVSNGINSFGTLLKNRTILIAVIIYLCHFACGTLFYLSRLLLAGIPMHGTYFQQ